MTWGEEQTNRKKEPEGTDVGAEKRSNDKML